MPNSRIMYLSDGSIYKAGGAQLSMRIVMDGLGDEYEFFMISPDENAFFENHMPIKGAKTLVPSKNGPWKTFGILFQLRKIIIEINPDIIHIQTSSAAVLMNALYLMGLIPKSISLIYTDREVYKRYGKMTRWSIDCLIKRAEYVITTTQNNLDNYRLCKPDFPTLFDRFTVIPNTAGNGFEVPSTREIVKENPVIGFCSRFIPNKNWSLAEDVIVKLLEKKDSLKIIAAIGSDEKYSEEMNGFISRMTLRFPGRADISVDMVHGELVELFDQMDIFVMTSSVESFGRTAVEAMARRTVVFGTGNDGIPEVIGDKSYLYDSASDVTEKIINLIDDSELLKKEKDRFYDRYQDIYKVEKNILSHKKIYHATLDRKTKDRIMFLGPLPPPIGGDTVSFSRIIKSRFFENYSKSIIDTSRKGTMRITGRKTDLSDIMNGLKVLWKVLSKVSRYDTLIFYANRRFLYTVGLGVIIIEKLFGKKVIIRVFGGSFHREFDRLPGIYKKIALGVLKKMDYFLVQSKELRQYLIENYDFNAEQVVHYPNFIPDEVIRDIKKGKRDTSALRCIYIGQIKREKGVFDIINARRQYPQFTCDFYGPIYGRDEHDFFIDVEDTMGIQYRGVVEPDDVCSVISEYDLLMLPSYHDGEGYAAVVFEAFSVGVPVIVTDWNAFPEFIRQWENGVMVPIKDTGAIVKTLKEVNNNLDIYNRLCEGASETSLQYSEKKIVGECLLLLVKKEVKKWKTKS